jgi:hypothetical protein
MENNPRSKIEPSQNPTVDRLLDAYEDETGTLPIAVTEAILTGLARELQYLRDLQDW